MDLSPLCNDETSAGAWTSTKNQPVSKRLRATPQKDYVRMSGTIPKPRKIKMKTVGTEPIPVQPPDIPVQSSDIPVQSSDDIQMDLEDDGQDDPETESMRDDEENELESYREDDHHMETEDVNQNDINYGRMDDSDMPNDSTFNNPVETVDSSNQTLLPIGVLSPTKDKNIFWTRIDGVLRLIYLLPEVRKPFPLKDRTQTRIRMGTVETVAKYAVLGMDGIIKPVTDSGSSLLKNAFEKLATKWDGDNEQINTNSKKPKLPFEAVEALQATCDIPLTTMRTMRQLCRLSGFKGFLRPHGGLLKRINKRSKFLKYIQTGELVTDADGESRKVTVVKLMDLKRAVEEYVKKTGASLAQSPGFKGKLWLRLGVDKGGGYTKVCISVANREDGLINSRHNWLMVGAYNDDDDAICLRKYLSSVFEELNEITTLEVKGQNMVLEKSLIGDFMSIAAVLGLTGPNATHPCLFCLVSKEDMRNGKVTSLRTLTEGIAKSAESGTNRDKKGYRMPPLIRGDWVVAVPMLHVMMKPATDLFKEMERDVKKAATRQTAGQVIDDGTWSLSTTIDSGALAEVKRERKELIKAQTAFNAWQKKNPGGFVFANDACKPWCVYEKRKKIAGIPWYLCTTTNCHKWEHCTCTGLLRKHAEKNTLIKCTFCEVNAGLKVEEIGGRFKTSIAELDSIILNADQLEEGLKSNMVYALWKGECVSHGVTPGIYHGGTLPGNQAKCFLRNATSFTNILRKFGTPAAVKRAAEYDALLEPLSRVNQLSRAGFLDDSELEDLEAAIDKLKELAGPGTLLPYSPKIHLLLHHTVPFAKKFRTLGIHSEQGLESMHAQFTITFRRYGTYGNGAKRLQAVMRAVNNRNIAMMGNRICLAIHKNALRKK